MAEKISSSLKIENIFTNVEINKLKQVIEEIFKLENYQIEIENGSNVGDNYIGRIYKIVIKNSTAKLNLIMKLSMRNHEFRKITPIEKFYQRENYMYTKILPYFEKLQENFHLNEIFQNYPKIYAASVELNQEYFIMNDLTSLLYHHLDRKQPLNLEHCRLFMKTIGTLHALSFALKENCQRKNIDFNEIVDKVREDIFLGAANRDEINEQILLQNDFIIKTCLDPIVDHCIIEKVNKFSKRFCDTLYELIQPKNNDDYSVIIHGDCWANNLMFKYENNDTKSKPTDLFLIDFQESRYTSPVWDLTVFMCTSMDYETISTNFDALIKIYYDTINEQLQKMDLNISILYPDNIFQFHLQKYFQIGVGLSVYMQLPIMLRDHSTSINELEESVIAEDGNFLKALNLSDSNVNDHFKERIRGILRFATERNFI